MPPKAGRPPHGRDPLGSRRLCCRLFTLSRVEAESARLGDKQGDGAQQTRQPPRHPHGSLRGGRALSAPGPLPQQLPAARAEPAPRGSSMLPAPLRAAPALPSHPLPREAAPRSRYPSSQPLASAPSPLSAAGVGEDGPSRPFLRLPCPRRRRRGEAMPGCLQAGAIPGPALQSGPGPGPPPGQELTNGGGSPRARPPRGTSPSRAARAGRALSAPGAGRAGPGVPLGPAERGAPSRRLSPRSPRRLVQLALHPKRCVI